MSKPPRCHKCGHRPGRRVLFYVKTKGGSRPNAVRRMHKHPCDCDCHTMRAAA